MKKTTPSSLVALAVVSACLGLHLVYLNIPFNRLFRKIRNQPRKSPPLVRETFDQPIPASSLAAPFTCDTNSSAVIDSFGNPCLNVTAQAKHQAIFSYRSNDLSYLYCGIPKNGCTVHKGVMQRLLGYRYEGGYAAHNPINSVRIAPGEEITQMLLDDIRRYAIVRNPIQRLLSGYLNKVERTYTDHSLKTPETFRKWVYDSLHPGMDWKGVNPHWISQLNFCGFKTRDLSSYFTLFRVEKPEEYVKYMEEFLPNWILKDGWDMPRNRSFRDHVLGPRTRTENTSERFFEYMGNVGTFDYIRQVYTEDIAALGYEREVDDLRRKLVERVGENR